MMRLAIVLAVLIGSGAGLAAQERPAGPCTEEVRKLCAGRGGGGIRSCIRENWTEFSASCRSALLERARERGGGADRALPTQVVRYGDHQRQAVDYFAAAGAARPPLVLFVHGGGWAFGNRATTVGHKAAWFTAHGYAFASAGYRVLPDAPVEDQARDVAAAVHAVRADAARLGFDPDRIVLMGHSAGAHLAALVATDPTYAGADFAAIKGVILLDGAGYDVASGMAGRQEAAVLYRNAFGTDASRQRRLSPASHTAAPNAPHWLILHVAARAESGAQSRMLGDRLVASGSEADVVAVPNTTHGRLNQDLGADGDDATASVEQFLRRLFPAAR